MKTFIREHPYTSVCIFGLIIGIWIGWFRVAALQEENRQLQRQFDKCCELTGKAIIKIESGTGLGSIDVR